MLSKFYKIFLISFVAMLLPASAQASSATITDLSVSNSHVFLDYNIVNDDVNEYFTVVNCEFEFYEVRADDSQPISTFYGSVLGVTPNGLLGPNRCAAELPDALDLPRDTDVAAVASLRLKVRDGDSYFSGYEFVYRSAMAEGPGFDHAPNNTNIFIGVGINYPTNALSVPSANNAPVISNVRLEGSKWIADVVDPDAGESPFIDSCTIDIMEPGVPENFNLYAEFYSNFSHNGNTYNNVCVSDMPNTASESTGWLADVSATDGPGDTGYGSTSSPQSWFHIPPTVDNITVYGRSLVADVADDYNNFVDSECQVEYTYDSTTVQGIGDIDYSLGSCVATLPAEVKGDFSATVTVEDDQGLTASDTEPVLSVPELTYDTYFTGTQAVEDINDELIGYNFTGDIISVEGASLSASATTINGCSFDVYYNFDSVSPVSIEEIEFSQNAIPGLTRPGVYHVQVEGTYDEGTATCTAAVPDEVGDPFVPVEPNGYFNVLVGFITLDVSSTNDPPVVSNIRLVDNRTVVADASDSDGTVVSCEIQLSQGPYNATVPGVYDSGEGTCSGDLPVDAPHGNLDVTVVAVDDDGAPGSNNSTVNHVNAPPVVSNIRLVDNNIVYDADDEDGVIDDCEATISQGGYSRDVTGSYDSGTKTCTVVLPEDAPHGTLTVVSRATDNDGAEGQDTNSVEHANAAPVVSQVRLEGKTLKAHADDSDGTIVSCSFTVSQGGYNQVVNGTYNAADKTCVGALPTDAPHGSISIVAYATDDDGATGEGSGNGEHANASPVVSNIRVVDGKILADADDSDGHIVTCTVRIDGVDYVRVISGVYDTASKVCTAVLPADAPETYTVTVVATDNDGAPGQDAGAQANPAADTNAQALTCSKGRIIVTNVRVVGKRAHVQGIAPKSFVGKEVTVKARFSKNKIIGRAKVAADGTFLVKALLPSKQLIGSNKAFYRATVNGQKSKELKLTRYLTVKELTPQTGKKIKVSGFVEKKYPGQKVNVFVAYDCGKGVSISNLRVKGNGTFSGTVVLKTDAKVANVYLRTKAKNKKKSFYTYSITQPLVLK